jgi:hypothetical protein
MTDSKQQPHEADVVPVDLELGDEEAEQVTGGRKAGEKPMDYLTINPPPPPPPPTK